MSEPRLALQSPFRLSMPSISPGQLAFSAMQYLPMPTIVLNSLKTVVLANEAVGRLLGLIPETGDQENGLATMDRLRGKSLSQVGIDMLQDGRPVRLPWEVFLDAIVIEMGTRGSASEPRRPSIYGGDATPTTATDLQSRPPPPRSLTRPSQDTLVDVVVSRKDPSRAVFDQRSQVKEFEHQVFAKMIVTVWELEDKQTYFTLTFTNNQSTSSTLANTKRSIVTSSILQAAEKKSIATSNPTSVASSRESNSPSFHSPGAVSMSTSPLPPMGPPSAPAHSSTPSLLQKMILMKDALLDNTKMPIIAMWKDGSVTFPNKAARDLFHLDAYLDSSCDGRDLLQHTDFWTADFTRKLGHSEYPLSTLIRTETPYESMRVGMYDENGNRVVLDILGEAIWDDTTGEFLAGVVSGRDVTTITQEITQIKEEDDERFKLICDTMPQLVWTATPSGYNDFFNTRWYAYTGLTPGQCIGSTWQTPLHPDDTPEAAARWQHSLATGDPYAMEYRCRSKEGGYRWFLVRALAVRDKHTGEVQKWLGRSLSRSVREKLSRRP